MPTRKSLAEVDIVNGIRRDVVNLIWDEGAASPALPDVVAKFNYYSGPEWSTNPDYHGYVPAAPMEAS